MAEGFTVLQRVLENSIIQYFADKANKTVPKIDLFMRVCTCSGYNIHGMYVCRCIRTYMKGMRV